MTIEPPEGAAPLNKAGPSGGSSPREGLERAAVLAASRLSTNPVVLPLANAGLTAEIRLRRLASATTGRMLRAYRLLPQAEAARLREQVAVLEHRIDGEGVRGRPRGAGAGPGSARTRTGVPVNWFEGGSGPPLLLLNGWTASSLVWPQRFLDELERTFRVIRIDNRGSGWSRSAPAPFTVADLADDAFAVLSALGLAGATVVGTSMGGMVAQELALRHPEAVSRLVLVGTGPPAPASLPSDDATTWHMFRRRQPGHSYREYLHAMWVRAAAPGFAEEHPELLEELVEQLAARPTRRGAAMAQARAAGCWAGPSRLSRIAVPTVVVHGTEDLLRPVGNGMRLARLIPGAEYVELPGVGHLVPLEAGDQLLDIIGQGRGRS